MTLTFSGDFRALDRFASQVSKAQSSLVITSKQLAEETVDLIREGFELGQDPYNADWEPLVIRQGRPLEDTGGLKSSWHHSDVDRDGFRVESAKDYAVYHQRGTGIYGPTRTEIRPVRAKVLRIPGVGFRSSVKGTPVRRMVPDAGRLSTKWRTRYVETALEVLTEIFERKT